MVKMSYLHPKNFVPSISFSLYRIQIEEERRKMERGVNGKIYIAFRPYMEEVLVKVF
jgi:hypothetical protein